MALNIRNPETGKLAEALTRLTGETKTEAVTRFSIAKTQRAEQKSASAARTATHASMHSADSR